MTTEATSKPFESRLRDAAAHVEEDLRRVAAYINDEVVPEVRRNSSVALRTAAEELRKLAEHLETANQRTPPPPPR
jgi:bisphosphoglycerate-dependent phosphoglycerate mutase